ncbi:DUF2892 domain-containing protein [Halarcobacter sp.]|uniref:YgaP family membrane protein n=1 Tax=Halarcobacter sp. TaxID=2321133 RepID=UPI003A8E7431
MNKNVGNIDRALRIIVGLVIIVAGFIMNSWLGFIGLIPLATGIIRWCPLYCPFKINTCGTSCNKE